PGNFGVHELVTLQARALASKNRFTDVAMTVHCEGDCWIVERLGEKQDFEAELSRNGIKHEAFALHVLRRTVQGRKAGSTQDYSVTVTNVITERRHVYEGGAQANWVGQFSRDLANGAYSNHPRTT